MPAQYKKERERFRSADFNWHLHRNADSTSLLNGPKEEEEDEEENALPYKESNDVADIKDDLRPARYKRDATQRNRALKVVGLGGNERQGDSFGSHKIQ